MNGNISLIERGDPNELLDMDKAKEVGETLCQHYPNHPWIVCFQGRALIVRHAAINDTVVDEMGQHGFGFVLKHLDAYSSSDLAHNAVMAGGQLLEAFGLPRGAWDGRKPVLPSGWRRGKRDFQ
jgi:hypothetical protein